MNGSTDATSLSSRAGAKGAAPSPVSKAKNAFDFLRLAAALAVLVSHNFAILGQREPTTATGHTLGAISVLVFFSVSGYLVTQSMARSSSLKSFAIKRGLRIYPGLIVALLFCTVMIGPLMTTLPLDVYLKTETTWRFTLRFFGFAGEDRLPGVFEHNLYQSKINASLWTIKHELICYVILGGLGALSWLLGSKKIKAHVFSAIVALVTAILIMADIAGVSTGGLIGGWVGAKLSPEIDFFFSNFFGFAAAFFFGAYFAQSESSMWSNPIPVGLACLVLGASLLSQSVAPLMPAAVCIVSLWAAVSLPRQFHHLTRGRDWSYGVYIYAFPIQQATVSIAGTSLGYMGTLVVSVVVTLSLAALSWRFVEQPALALKRRF